MHAFVRGKLLVTACAPSHKMMKLLSQGGSDSHFHHGPLQKNNKGCKGEFVLLRAHTVKYKTSLGHPFSTGNLVVTTVFPVIPLHYVLLQYL